MSPVTLLQQNPWSGSVTPLHPNRPQKARKLTLWSAAIALYHAWGADSTLGFYIFWEKSVGGGKQRAAAAASGAPPGGRRGTRPAPLTHDPALALRHPVGPGLVTWRGQGGGAPGLLLAWCWCLSLEQRRAAWCLNQEQGQAPHYLIVRQPVLVFVVDPAVHVQVYTVPVLPG